MTPPRCSSSEEAASTSAQADERRRLGPSRRVVRAARPTSRFGWPVRVSAGSSYENGDGAVGGALGAPRLRRRVAWAGHAASAWSLSFAGLHLYWAAGGGVGLAASAGAELARTRPAWFVATGLWGVAGVLILGTVESILLVGHRSGTGVRDGLCCSRLDSLGAAVAAFCARLDSGRIT